jgi:hypothetical protein
MNVVRPMAALFAAAVAGTSLPAVAAPDWDLLGVKLGMTEAQVRAAFQAFDPKAKVTAYQATLGYGDGLQQFRTPPYLDHLEIRAVRGVNFSPLRVWFSSAPVGEPRVIAIARQEVNAPNPPTRAQFEQALRAKYGQPSGSMGAGSNVVSPVWIESGKPSCAHSAYGEGRITLGEFPQIVTGQMTMSRVIGKFANGTPRDLRNPPADLSQCGAVMYYVASGDPVRNFDGAVFDLGAMVANTKKLQAWVEKLQAEAVKKREAKGQGPRL